MTILDDQRFFADQFRRYAEKYKKKADWLRMLKGTYDPFEHPDHDGAVELLIADAAADSCLDLLPRVRDSALDFAKADAALKNADAMRDDPNADEAERTAAADFIYRLMKECGIHGPVCGVVSPFAEIMDRHSNDNLGVGRLPHDNFKPTDHSYFDTVKEEAVRGAERAEQFLLRLAEATEPSRSPQRDTAEIWITNREGLLAIEQYDGDSIVEVVGWLTANANKSPGKRLENAMRRRKSGEHEFPYEPWVDLVYERIRDAKNQFHRVLNASDKAKWKQEIQRQYGTRTVVTTSGERQVKVSNE